ncbi:ATP-binding protein [Rosettibacter firmus]|uniref:ATP-binding protein n=1 Tax=Rosettibacter firmus TaxID=3111522 RepID=UPI00336BB8C6
MKLIELNIDSNYSIIDAREKFFVLLTDLGFSVKKAAKICVVISEITRSIYKKYINKKLIITLEDINNFYSLNIQFPKCFDMEKLNYFFDDSRIIKKNNNEYQIASLLIDKHKIPSLKKFVDSEKEKLMYIISANNVDELKRIIEEKTSEIIYSSKLLDSILNNMGEGVYVVDMNSNAIYVNNTCLELLGYDENELISNNMHLLIHHHKKDLSEYPAEECPILKSIQNKNSILVSNEVFWRKDGTCFSVEYNATPLIAENKVLGGVIIFRDISERIKAEEAIKKLNEELEQKVIERTQKLLEANKELESFSYSISHDLRAPLRHIIGFIELLSKKYTFEDKAAQYFNIITTTAKRMSQLIEDLLNFSRIGRASLKLTEVDLNEILRSLLTFFKDDIEKRNIQINIQTLPRIYADYILIQQVWQNLISNAIKYTSKCSNPCINIGFKKNKNFYTFYIEDNGIGFDMKYIDKLFNVFQRLHIDEEFEGTGIGLAITKKIIEKHGGKIWAEAKINEGAKFYFTLPIEYINEKNNLNN